MDILNKKGARNRQSDEIIENILKVDKKTITKKEVEPHKYNKDLLYVKFKSLSHTITFVLNEEKLPYQVHLVKGLAWYNFETKELDKKRKEQVYALFNDYVHYFNLKLKLLLS